MTNALELNGVVKRYGRLKALNGLDLAVPTGSIFGLVGSNGAGKTTSMAVSIGLLRPTAGSVNLLGAGPFHPLRHAGRVTILPQDSRLPLHSRVEELLRYYGRLQGLTERESSESVEDVLEWTHLRERRRSAVRTLSHGMMRRLTIAQAFLGRPELALLDEPLSGLDPREAIRIREIIRGRRGRQTVLISSHNLNEIEAICDTVAFVEGGRLVRQDSLEAIVKRSHRLTYTLEPGKVPLSELQTLLPQCAWELNPEQTVLTAHFDGASTAATDVNAQALTALLRAHIGIVEIRRGSNLEAAYLDATDLSAAVPAGKTE